MPDGYFAANCKADTTALVLTAGQGLKYIEYFILVFFIEPYTVVCATNVVTNPARFCFIFIARAVPVSSLK